MSSPRPPPRHRRRQCSSVLTSASLSLPIWTPTVQTPAVACRFPGGRAASQGTVQHAATRGTALQLKNGEQGQANEKDAVLPTGRRRNRSRTDQAVPFALGSRRVTSERLSDRRVRGL